MINPKVAAGGTAGAAATLVVFIVGQFGLEVPAEASAALATLFAFGAGYLKSA